MITMTQAAINKALDVLGKQGFPILGLRVSVVGAGCSGFSYSLTSVSEINILDKIYEFEGAVPGGENKKLKVVVDQVSLLYLEGCEIDYLETLEASGFKFNNPNIKSTCRCGSSFSA